VTPHCLVNVRDVIRLGDCTNGGAGLYFRRHPRLRHAGSGRFECSKTNSRTPADVVPIVLRTLYASTELNLVANKYGIRKVVDKKSGALISAAEELLRTA
jgi:hypothetical protein